jgi:hypothetical protein
MAGFIFPEAETVNNASNPKETTNDGGEKDLHKHRSRARIGICLQALFGG